MSRRILSLILALFLLVGMIPSYAAPADALTVMHNIAGKYAASGIVSDVNAPWLAADAAAYRALFPDSENVLTDDEIQNCVDLFISNAAGSDAPGDLAKDIIALRALGFDARNVATQSLETLDIVSKLTALIDSEDSRVISIYTVPYVIIALGQGDGYATDEQMDFLISSILTHKKAWQNFRLGIDAATPVLLAFAPYYGENEEITEAVDETIELLKAARGEDGGFGSAASNALAIVALSSLGIDAAEFKNGENSLVDALLVYATEELDGFEPAANTFSTEQGFRALIAWQMMQNGGGRVYDFSQNEAREAHARCAEHCHVTFEILPEGASVTIEGIEQIEQNKYDLAAGEYSYTAQLDGYIAESGTLVITEDEDESHASKTVALSLMTDAPASDSITVSMNILAHDGEECGGKFTYKKNAKKYFPIVQTQIELASGQSVFDALAAALGGADISYTEKTAGYISRIGDYGEMDHSPNSGWLFMVDSEPSTKSCRDYVLTDDAEVTWFYTDDYTGDYGSEKWSGGGSSGRSSGGGSKSSSSNAEVEAPVIDSVAKYLLSVVPEPNFGSIGGEWAVLGLARSGLSVPDGYFELYYSRIEDYVASRGGILSSRKYTEYSRLVLALYAIGKDPRNTAGYDLTAPLDDYGSTVKQGLNGATWALIALDSGGFPCSVRQKYLELILSRQNEDGGWAVADGQASDIDMTAMVLCALSNYTEKSDVKSAVDAALGFLSTVQNKNGGFGESSESDAQVIVALCTLGIKIDDARFVKNKNSVLDDLALYYVKDQGFLHQVIDSSVNQMATEQAFYALAAIKRMDESLSPLYSIGEITLFDDVSENGDEINALARRGILKGREIGKFNPDANMTRAEFAAVVTRAFSLEYEGGNAFSDVSESDWYFEAVNAAKNFGIVNGVSATEFAPNSLLTQEEAATMLVRAAAMAGVDTKADSILPGSVSPWAKDAFCYMLQSGILNDANDSKHFADRSEIAYMLCNILLKADLL